ncbi:hypothetical protein ABT404_11750, partial [Streptomyces hyaluromycini]
MSQHTSIRQPSDTPSGPSEREIPPEESEVLTSEREEGASEATGTPEPAADEAAPVIEPGDAAPEAATETEALQRRRLRRPQGQAVGGRGGDPPG